MIVQRHDQPRSGTGFGTRGREQPTPPSPREAVEKWIGQHPVPSVSAAMILGVFFGWLIKRR